LATDCRRGGLSVEFTVAAVLGQHPLPNDASIAVAELLDLGDYRAKVTYPEGDARIVIISTVNTYPSTRFKVPPNHVS
jgi:hypothetical protein